MASLTCRTTKSGFLFLRGGYFFFKSRFEHEGARFVLAIDDQSNGHSLVTIGKWSWIFGSTTGSGCQNDFKVWASKPIGRRGRPRSTKPHYL